MRLAVLADIHGNADALDAVLADVAARSVDRIVLLGDHFSGPLDAAGTARRLVGLDATAILGNHDRYLLTRRPEAMGASDRVAHDRLSPGDLDWLRGLPATAVLDEGRVFLCHGTPTSDETYLLETVTPDGRLALADRAGVEARLAGVAAGLVLCAHSHAPRVVRLAGDRLVVNPGSVGCPGYVDDDAPAHVMQTGNPDAAYALVERTAGRWHASLRTVPYDPRRMADMAAEAGRPEWAAAVGTGWIG